MNAVIYARYSSENQREESIEGQIRECEAYATSNGINIIEKYIDRAYSATNDQRPEFQRMISDSKRHLFEAIIVWKLDRFSRNKVDNAIYKSQLKKDGVRVVSAMEPISDTPEGELLESTIENINVFYSKELAVKVNRGLKENAFKCKYNGGAMTYGYTTDDNQMYIVEPNSAAVVREVFELYAQGWTMQAIADKLEKDGVRTISKKGVVGAPMRLTAISNMLKNRKYLGEYRYADFVTPGGIPAIIDEDLFNTVQVRIANNKKAPAKAKAAVEFILTPKLYCGCCEETMVGTSGTSRNGQIYYYYKCLSKKHKKTCSAKHKTVKKDAIETIVVNAVKEKFMDDVFIKSVTKKVLTYQAQENQAMPSLRKQLKETENSISNLVGAIEAGAYNESIKQRLDQLEAQKKALETNIAIEQLQKPQLTEEQIRFWLLHFRQIDAESFEGRRQLVDSFVNKVVIYDDRILVVFNYKNGSTQVSFDDIECSDITSRAPPLEKIPKTVFKAVFGTFFVFYENSISAFSNRSSNIGFLGV